MARSKSNTEVKAEVDVTAKSETKAETKSTGSAKPERLSLDQRLERLEKAVLNGK